ncbi:hypothetical protein DFH06DRAFT_1172621 [Mycena polygramma]|nr:hypothetical protein DFH06DRAFT_1172621 [Mycena polygramma]
MLARLTVALAVALVTLSTGVEATLVNCAACSSTFFYKGLTRALTTVSAGENVLDCHYASPDDATFSPTCSYREADGHLTSTNTVAVNGVCPNPATVVKKSTCNGFS